MLERVHVENYKCLRDVTVDLEKLTILIGPNDSGKSSFLDVLIKLGKIATKQFAETFKGDTGLENLVWRKEGNRNIVWEISGQLPRGQFDYRVEIPVELRPPAESFTVNKASIFTAREPKLQVTLAQGTVVGEVGTTILERVHNKPQWDAPHFRELIKSLESAAEFHLDPRQMSQVGVPKPNDLLCSTGANLVGFLDNILSGADRQAFPSLERDLHTAIPTLLGISLPSVPQPAPAGTKAIHFVLAGDSDEPVIIPASLASGGALLLTAFLALSYSRSPDLLLIEEPENGLHPSRLKLVVDVFRKMTTGELGGRPRQIVLTTHSPLLLNYATPEEVRVFIRDPETGTRVTPMASIPDADRLLKEFALGELWYLLGEEKLFQEQPA